MVAADQANVTAGEAAGAANTGTFGDYDDAVSITPSVGAVTQSGSQSGIWSWSGSFDDNGDYPVTITATNADGSTATTSFTVHVTNVAPTPAIGGASAGVPFEPLSFTASATDPSTADTAGGLTLSVDWGEGNPAEIVAGSPTHSFAASGTYTVTLTATDKDGGSATATQIVTITPFLVQGSDLLIGGTLGDDSIVVRPGNTAGQYKVILNGANLGNTFSPSAVHVFGGGGNDDLAVNGDGDANAFEVHGDRLVLNGLAVFGDSVESRTANALGSTDTITVYDGAATVNGGGGSDTLIAAGGINVFALSGPGSGTLNGQVVFSGIEQLTGAGSDTLNGANSNNVWKVTGSHSGTLGNFSFTGMGALIGGSAADTFRVTEGVASGLSIDGGGGADKLDYGSFATGVNVNLAGGTATGYAQVAGIENVAGGSGNDILRGDASNNILAGGAGNDIVLGGAGNDTVSGGAGRDILVGGTGSDVIAGNADEDLLIDGTTSYDANDAALIALLNAWSGAATYTAGVNAVSTGVGVAGGYRLVGDDGGTQTVFTDNDVDTLTGSGGQDFFFANKTGDNGGPIDNVTDQSAKEVWDDTDF
jgi:hypothetical protein